MRSSPPHALRLRGLQRSGENTGTQWARGTRDPVRRFQPALRCTLAFAKLLTHGESSAVALRLSDSPNGREMTTDEVDWLYELFAPCRGELHDLVRPGIFVLNRTFEAKLVHFTLQRARIEEEAADGD